MNTIRHQLKAQGINSGWREIVRTMNTQKAVTTLAQNQHDEVIMIRRCSEPNQNVRKLYDALKYKYAPFVKRKSVVHKSELEKKSIHLKPSFIFRIAAKWVNGNQSQFDSGILSFKGLRRFPLRSNS